jgi:sec-independent protein translocase protein TatC
MAPLDQELPNEKQMGFLDHLEELRSRLFKSLFAIFIGAGVLFVKKDWVFDMILFGPRNPEFFSFKMWCKLSNLIGAGDKLCVNEIKYELINTSMLGNFSAHIMVSLVGGIILVFPYLMLQVWGFVKPALKKTERNSIRGIGFSSSLLFFAGVAFGYWGIVPLSLQFLGGYEIGDVAARIAVMSYVKTVATIALASGLIFQLPVVVYFLARAGVVTPEMLRSYRKHALVGILIISAIITPPDLTSQILVSIPVLFLYEIGILIARRQQRKRKKKNRI